MKILVQESLADNFSPDRLILLSHFVKYCVRALDLHEELRVFVVDDRHRYGIETTASYVSDELAIYVYGKGRSFVDILKSISHEMVHAKQHELGYELPGHYLHFHSEVEDEANAEGMTLLNAYTEVMGRDIIYDN